MPVVTHPHLRVVGVGNPIAMLGLARLGVRRGEIQQIRSARSSVAGKPRNGRLEKIVCTLLAPRSPARPVRYVFSTPYPPHISSHLGTGAFISRACEGEEGTAGSTMLELAAAAWISAKVGRSLAVDWPCDLQDSMGGE
jgi:hypothetical protein